MAVVAPWHYTQLRSPHRSSPPALGSSEWLHPPEGRGGRQRAQGARCTAGWWTVEKHGWWKTNGEVKSKAENSCYWVNKPMVFCDKNMVAEYSQLNQVPGTVGYQYYHCYRNGNCYWLPLMMASWNGWKLAIIAWICLVESTYRTTNQTTIGWIFIAKCFSLQQSGWWIHIFWRLESWPTIPKFGRWTSQHPDEYLVISEMWTAKGTYKALNFTLSAANMMILTAGWVISGWLWPRPWT